ncbi:hypothetical protein [Clostridium felsineum]|uniref:hypothetical protein n=1 Tax=Clostridium felsineum TaxID=36839 RepID=UPI0011154AAD|nr:hypothetical protein [Clostridium felsineum]
MAFEGRIKEITGKRPVPTIEERKQTIDLLNDDYLEKTGQTLPPYFLGILTAWLLYEQEKKKEKNKNKGVEYSYLTQKQLDYRRSKEISVKDNNLEFLNLKYNLHMDSLNRKKRADFEE